MLRFALAAAALAGFAYADEECSASGTTTLSNVADATGISGCSTYSGSIAIATGVAGQFDLPGIKQITGNLVSQNVSRISQFSASNLEVIGGNFTFEDNQVLDTITMGKLTEVAGIQWSGLPTLSNVVFTTGLQKAPTIDIRNTGLSRLDTIFPPLIDTIFIANNGQLQSLEFKLGNISDKLDLAGNGDRLVVNFPNLVWGGSLTFRNLTNLTIPLLEEARGNLGFYGNKFESLQAPNLTKVGGAFTIAENDRLTNLSFPLLSSVNDSFVVANNTQLSVVSGFPELTTVKGAFDVSGNISEVDVPKLKSVQGVFNIQSSEDITSTCDDFRQRSKDDSSFVRGKFVCAGALANPAGQDTDPGSNNNKVGAASAAGMPSIVALVALAGVIVSLA